MSAESWNFICQAIVTHKSSVFVEIEKVTVNLIVRSDHGGVVIIQKPVPICKIKAARKYRRKDDGDDYYGDQFFFLDFHFKKFKFEVKMAYDIIIKQ